MSLSQAYEILQCDPSEIDQETYLEALAVYNEGIYQGGPNAKALNELAD